jgi:RarD protein
VVSKGLLENISAMVIFGTVSLCVKNIAISSAEIAFWRIVIAISIILLIKLIRHQTLPFKSIKKDLPLLALSGIAISGDWILFFEAYKYTSVSVATLSYYFCPVLLMVLSPFIFKERVSLKQCVCFALATLGLVLIISARPSGSSTELLGIALSLCAAVCYACIIILNKKITSVSGLDKTMFQFLSALIVLSVYVPITSGFHVSELDAKGLVCLIILAVVYTTIAYSLYFSSVSKLTGAKVALLSYIDPLIAVIVSIVILSEQITLLQLIGGVMILGFTVFNELTDLKRPKACA